jgi:hypothetical protein
MRSPTGNRIVVSGDKDSGYNIQLHPNKSKWFNSNSKLHCRKTDWLFMMQMLRATGKESVTININTKHDSQDNKYGLIKARIAYEAALEAGFLDRIKDKDGKEQPNITIRINGKPIELDKIYVERHIAYREGQKTDDSEHYLARKAQKAEMARRRGAMIDANQNIKAELDALRKKAVDSRKEDDKKDEPADDALSRVDSSIDDHDDHHEHSSGS